MSFQHGQKHVTINSSSLINSEDSSAQEQKTKTPLEGQQASAPKPIPMRTRSLSYSAPVSRDVYQSLPQSPATKFLSEFAYRDDSFDIEGFEEGKVVKNYLVGPLIGGGGFGECRQAYVINRNMAAGLGEQLPEKVALKIITDPRCLRDFDYEVTIWRRLKHPNILPLLDYITGSSYRIAVSPLIEGGNLQEYLVQKGPLAEREARVIFAAICQGIHYLHVNRRVAHLDLKLENVLIDMENEKIRVLLCDFGLSYWADDRRNRNRKFDSLQPNDAFCSGSITSIPPEVLSSEASSASECSDISSFEAKTKQDIWALGVLLYALVCGRLPFYDDYLPRLQHTIISGTYEPLPDHFSSHLRQLIEKLLNTNSNERPDIGQILCHDWLVIKKTP